MAQAHTKSSGLNYDPPMASGLQGEPARKQRKKQQKGNKKLNIVYVQYMGMNFCWGERNQVFFTL